MRTTLLVAVIAGLLAGCPADSDHSAPASLSTAANAAPATVGAQVATDAMLPVAHSSVAAMPDRGSLLAYPAQAPIRRGAAIWHPVQMSEAHALAAIAAGGMVINTPDGEPIRLKYVSHVEHPDGNWSWIGRPQGAGAGQDVVLTFGPRAVFGSIPVGNGQSLDITTSGGRTWMVETDQRIAADERYAAATAIASDALAAPKHAATRGSAAPSKLASGATAVQTITAGSSSAVVDLVVGYTTTFASRLGGKSQAVTRLNNMVDVANQAYAASRVSGRVRLVHTIMVDYPDATLNRQALFDLSGLNCSVVSSGQLHLPDIDANCTAGTVPAALQPLIAARDKYGADLASLVRTYQVPENQSCGVSWLIGGGQTAIDASDAPYALSVVSDTSGSQFPDNGSTCRNETLAHELGHNMGLAHDAVAAARSNGTLEANEYGRYANSFGYSTDSAHGNFYTIMSIPVAGQKAYRLFSNPRISDCGGLACGAAGQADNAGTLALTMPAVANFRATKAQTTGVGLSGDFNGDGKADIFWRNTANGGNVIWKSGNSATPQAVTAVKSQDWVVAGAGDFNGDGKSDIFWRNTTTGVNAIWLSANSATPQAVSPLSDLDWEVAGIGDFSGDGTADVLWRNSNSGANVIWRAGNSRTATAVQAVTDTSWTVGGVGDFNGDHIADILWRHGITGQNIVWRSGNSSTVLRVATAQVDWNAAGVADFNGDGKADIFWRNTNTGSNVIWLSANASTPLAVSPVRSTDWNVVGLGDFGADHKGDVLWRNTASGANALWNSGSAKTPQDVSRVSDQRWIVAN